MSSKQTANPMSLIKAGREAAKAIPGMPGRMVRGMFMNFGVFFLLMAVSNSLVYFLLLSPVQNWAANLLPDKLDWFASGLTIILMIAMVIGSLFLAMRWSFAVMHLWYEGLAEKVLLHQHPGLKEHKTSGSFGDVILDILKELLVMIGLLLLNLIPAIGSILSLVWTAHRIGLSNYQPYNAVLRAHSMRDQRVVLKFLRLPTLLPGALLLGMALIPFVGWLVLWWMAMHMVIGASWLHARQIPANLVEPANTSA